MKHNPSFKRPVGDPPLRSPSPPRAFVEPISPLKPTPIEPSFNYPPINNHLDFSVRPESSQNGTSLSDSLDRRRKNEHARRPSTIDTLAEAALALSPARPSQPRKPSVSFQTNDVSRDLSWHHSHGATEPPHKRARSELLPSPYITQYASRPATSYETANYATQSHRSRFEEAELLLNFQSSGRSNSQSSMSQPFFVPPRPHANSFPQDAYHIRPSEAIAQPQPSLLPAFEPTRSSFPSPSLPSPVHKGREVVTKPVDPPIPREDVRRVDSAPLWTELPRSTDTQPETKPEAGSAFEPSEDATPVNEAGVNGTLETGKGKRGWPKGKPRGSGAKKAAADKSGAKKPVSKKKAADAKGRKAKANGSPSPPIVSQESRRKSFSDVPAKDETSRRDSARTSSRSTSVPREIRMLVRDAPSAKPTRRKAKEPVETICFGCHKTRERSRIELDEWIACNGCKNWFHIDCAGFNKAHELRDVDKYFCATCEPQHGKTTYVRKSARAHASVDYAELQKGVLKTSEESMEHHYIQPIKDGTFQFDSETFPRIPPELVTRDYFERSGLFTEPICIPAAWNPRPWDEPTSKSTGDEDSMDIDGGIDQMEGLYPSDFEYSEVPDYGQDRLEMVMPQGLTVRHVCNLVGGDWPLDVIDVKTQNSGAKWNLNKWADYYEQVGEEKEIRNVISLEVSQTKLGKLLQRPKIVRDIDLQDDVWPQEEIDKGKLPKVQFYCLMSVADSYTDFHIDFGGSSVYYHILEGSKTFFFIPPKPKHLKAYEEWNDSPQQNFTFLPHITKECYRVDLFKGDTMLIPSGWIHAVWTPSDSLVIGGNFLNRMSYKNQFRVVEIEKANETPMKFRYPYFQKVMWYTAIKYLKTDPLPEAVSQLFYAGQQFERELPIWADFEGDWSNNDESGVGGRNARYYSQAEVEGLPELVNFIFRTVMMVMGRVEGLSQDRMRRVNASIPKGYGEPLELAKTFALWVAWKRGNEDPPAWAHPDAVLPNDKDDGPPKKLSERKLKELEKREAIAAWRVAPDRQSARVMNKTATAAAATTAAADATANAPSPASSQPPFHQTNAYFHQDSSYAPRSMQHSPSAAPPASFVMSSNQFLSTPKTSVLGPKRVACDSCRKRRIKCKHKDMVMEATPPSGAADAHTTFQMQLAPELHDNITVTTPQHRIPPANALSMPPDTYSDGFANGIGPLPGTNAYISAHIPMMMNGVPINGGSKRGRTKACYECRKSKRRCIHNENGEVDPVKASETPLPRGSAGPKKQQSSRPHSPLLVERNATPPPIEFNNVFDELPPPPSPQMQGHGMLKPERSQPYNPAYPSLDESRTRGPAKQYLLQRQRSESEHASEEPQLQPQIDPSLFSLPLDSGEKAHTSAEHVQAYRAPLSHPPQQNAYPIPSLEQIANEVLVDMNGNEYHDLSAHVQQQPAGSDRINGFAMGSGSSKQHDSADSAIMMTSQEPSFAEQAIANGILSETASHSTPADPDTIPIHRQVTSASNAPRSSIEGNGVPPPISHSRSKSGATELPLYKPPQPLSQSPELTKRAPVTNGAHPSPEQHKRKREGSTLGTPVKSPAMKKTKVEDVANGTAVGAEGGADDQQSEELARVLQAEDRGLRRRGSR